MKALCWTGINALRVETVPDPEILTPHDAILRVRMSGTCGADLHLLHGFVPTMRAGDIIGHEFVGEVVEVGPQVDRLQRGARVAVSAVIGCGQCYHCARGAWSLCDNSNPNGAVLEKAYGHATAGLLGYAHGFGGYAGAHAEYVRVPFADHGCFPVPPGLTDEQALFCSVAFPTGYMAAEQAGIAPGDVVAVWGCGGVGQMAVRSAYLLGAERVIAIDRVPARLEMARAHGGADVLDYEAVDVLEALREMTGGRGPDACIDAVGMEAHTPGATGYVDRARQALRLQSDRPAVLRQAILACRKGGTVSVVGTYAGLADHFPIGPAMHKGLTLRMGRMHGQKYIPHLLEHVRKGEVDPSYLATHHAPLDDGPAAYRLFQAKADGCVRVVFNP